MKKNYDYRESFAAEYENQEKGRAVYVRKEYASTLVKGGFLVLLTAASLLWSPFITARAEEEVSDSQSAAELVADIPTTQYFTDEEVAEEDIETILTAGINSPSSMNSQSWHFSAITDSSVLQQISDDMSSGMSFSMDDFSDEADAGDTDDGETAEDTEEASDAEDAGTSSTVTKAGIADAPLAIVISCAEGSELDAGLACQTMSVEAQLLGYGTKIISSPTIALNGDNQEEYRELLGIPEDYSVVAILLVGYEDTSIDESVDGYTAATTRNSLEEMVTYVEP